MNFRYCIFDIDGTIVDTEKTGVLSLIQTVHDLMGRDMPYEEAYPYFGIPSSKVGGMLGYPDEEFFWNEWEKRFAMLRHLMVPFDGILDVISDVRKSGAVTGIITSRSHREMEMDDSLDTIVRDISFAVCAGDTERPKPFPDPVFRFIELVSAAGNEVKNDECIYIGDMIHDCECAHAAGIKFALADWHRRGGQGIPADCIFSDAAGLRRILGLD